MGPSSLLIQWGEEAAPRVLEQPQSQAVVPCLYLHNQRDRGKPKQVPNGFGESDCWG